MIGMFPVDPYFAGGSDAFFGSPLHQIGDLLHQIGDLLPVSHEESEQSSKGKNLLTHTYDKNRNWVFRSDLAHHVS
jgi:hypothetical protein